MKHWMSGLDAIFSIESYYISNLWPLAKRMGLRISYMPNAEWLDPRAPLNLVDTFIAPTRACLRLLTRLGFQDRSVYIPHPVNTERFGFRERTVANLFLHCRGWGGYKERKGTDILFETARLCHDARFLVRTQDSARLGNLRNVRVVGPSRRPEDLYEVGDVAIQPSRWEGVGLQILEAMACGIPVIVPNAAPMNEYPADQFLCVAAARSRVMLGDRPWRAWEIDPVQLASLIRRLNRTDISILSRNSRAKMERRSWTRIHARLISALGM